MCQVVVSLCGQGMKSASDGLERLSSGGGVSTCSGVNDGFCGDGV
jgi:hypothetical protein